MERRQKLEDGRTPAVQQLEISADEEVSDASKPRHETPSFRHGEYLRRS